MSLLCSAEPGMASPRHVLIAGCVVLFHLVALWALQAGLLQRAVEVLVPVQLLSQLIEPALPRIKPPPVSQPPDQVKQPLVRRAESLPPPPMPAAIAEATSEPNAPTGVAQQPVALPAISAPVAATAVAASPPTVDLPSNDADYLHNPKPAYPALSKRLGEQGKVVVRVLIDTDGTAKNAEIRQSSGFERLDLAALATVQRWRYVPGKRGGVPEAMWFNVPINFVME